MSYLGHANPFYHLGHIMRGYLVAPPSLSHAVRFLHHWATICGMTPIQTIPWVHQWGGEGLLCMPVPSPSTGEGRCFRSDLLEEIRPQDVKMLVVSVRIEQPRGRRDTA
jgi:hypothetical protein